MNNSQGHYNCSAEDGTRICHKHWYGPNCTVYCAPRNDSKGHYLCDHSDGSKMCHTNWYGRHCSTHCAPRNDSKGHYDCGPIDGSKICHQDWYGANCSVRCVSKDDATGHYTCDVSDGSKLCYKYWFGPNCTIFCRPQDSYQGHYTCHTETGHKVCIEGWEGEECLHGVTTGPPETVSPPTTAPRLESTEISFTSKLPSDSGILPIEKQSRSEARRTWMTKTRIGLISGGFALLLCLITIAVIVLLSCRSRHRKQPFQYRRQHNEKGNDLGNSLDRRASGRVNPATDVLSQYEMNDMFFKVQEVSWGEDGSRQVEDHLVMYNNPLFTKRDQIKSSVSTRQLALDSEWNVVFDL